MPRYLGIKEPLKGEVTGTISLFDFEGTNYEAYKNNGPSCLTLDQLVDARREARARNDTVAAQTLHRQVHLRLSSMQRMLRRSRRRR